MGTPNEGLRGQWVINSSCPGLATVTAELSCTERTGESAPRSIWEKPGCQRFPGEARRNDESGRVS